MQFLDILANTFQLVNLALTKNLNITNFPINYSSKNLNSLKLILCI